jgi:hypothetical protein
MTDREDQAFEAFLRRESEISRRYRAQASEVPPPDADAAILAASRREAGARPRAVGQSRWRKWQAPLSIAAVLMLSLGVTLRMIEHEERMAEPPAATSPPVVPAAPPVTEQEAKQVLPEAQAPAGETQGRVASPPLRDKVPLEKSKRRAHARAQAAEQRDAESANEVPRERGADSAADQAPAAAQSEAATNTARGGQPKKPLGAAQEKKSEADRTRDSRDEAQAPAAKAEMAQSPREGEHAAAPAAASPQALRRDESPEQWIKRIVELRKQGRHEEADAELKAFKKRFADYALPPEVLLSGKN